MQLDHVTIRTLDLPKTRKFFIDVFGFQDGPRSQIAQQVPGYWLYWKDRPIVQLVMGHGSIISHVAEGVEYISFRLEGYAHFRARLDRLDVSYTPVEAPDIGERKLRFRTPGGTLIEAAFEEVAPHLAKFDEASSKEKKEN